MRAVAAAALFAFSLLAGPWPARAQDEEAPQRRPRRSAPSSLPQDLKDKGAATPETGGLDYVVSGASGSQTSASDQGSRLYVAPAGSPAPATDPGTGAVNPNVPPDGEDPRPAGLGDVRPVLPDQPGALPVANNDAARRLSEAYGCYKRKEWKCAADKATEALGLDESFEGHYLRAQANLWLRRYGEAEADARAASELRPRNGGALFYLAWALFKRGNFNEALRYAERAKVVDPGNAQAWYLAASLYDRFGRPKEALEAIETAANLDRKFRGLADEARSGGKIRYEPGDSGVSGVASELMAWFSMLQKFLGRAAFVALGLLVALALAGFGWMLGPKAAPPPRRPVADVPTAPTGGLPVGLLAGKYETIRVIGRGGMGDVLEARDTSLGRTVAIKRMSTRLADVGAQGRDLMLQEARTVAALHHPAIVDVFEVIEEGDSLYLVFEFVSGKTVQQMLAEARRLTIDRTIEILKPVCQALDFAHSRGVVHRDLKPSNIMVTDDGYPKLMDFGIARRMAERGPVAADQPQQAAPEAGGLGLDFVRTRTIVGTPLYMAPEMEQGIVCKESDVYSLGVCVYEMITGDRPFMEPATAFQKMQMDFLKPSLRIPEIPPTVDEVLTAALQPAPESRLHGAKEFLDRLRAAARSVGATG